MATFCKSFVTASLCGATEPSMPSMGRPSDNFLWLAWKQLYFICPAVSLFLWVYSVCTQKYQTLLASASPAAQSPPLSACLLILTAQGFVTLPLLFPLFFCLSLPHSVLSFHVLSSHPSSQSSFISRISLPQPPQPEMSQSLASCPPTLTKQRWECLCKCVYVSCSVAGFFSVLGGWGGGFYINMYKHTLNFLLQHLHVNMAQILKQKLTFYRINKSRSL